MATCKFCNITDDFYPNNKSTCKSCVRLRTKRWQQNNKDEYLFYLKNYRNTHKHVISEQKKVWYLDNKEYVNKKNYKNQVRLRKTNPRYRIHHVISAGIRNFLRGDKQYASWESIVGYSAYDLKNHLELQFKPGMSWDNYGFYGWHIDHIKPKRLFTIKEIAECWALSNLQPLWAEDNLKKGGRF